MSKGQIARMVTMLLIALILVLSVWGYGSEIGKVVNPVEYASDVYIDGADATGILNLFIAGANGFVGVIIAIFYCIFLGVIALILLLPWCLVVAIKKPVIAAVEIKVAIGTYIGVVVLSFIMGLVGARLNGALVILALTAVVAIMFGLMCILPYWLVYRRCKKEEMNYES